MNGGSPQLLSSSTRKLQRGPQKRTGKFVTADKRPWSGCKGARSQVYRQRSRLINLPRRSYG